MTNNTKNNNDENSIFDDNNEIYENRKEVLNQDDLDPDKVFTDDEYEDEDLEKDMERAAGEGQFDIELYETVKLKAKDLKSEKFSVEGMNRREIKTTVDLFYQVQKDRIALENQIRAINQEYDEDSPDNANLVVLNYLKDNMSIMEANTAKVIKKIVMSNEVGRWLVQIMGIGEVLAAGLLAYLDVEGKNYASHFISYAGLNDNNRPWLGKEGARAIVEEVCGKRGKITDDDVFEIALRSQWSYDHIRKHAWDEDKEKWSREKVINACAMVPYNRNLKKLMFKVGSSFQYQRNKENSVYGRLFSERQLLEMKMNEEGKFKDQAEHILATKNIGKSTKSYKAYAEGKLPKAHITMRALRRTEKIFLSHLFEEMYRVHNDKIPPRYYILDHSDKHHDEIAPEIPYTRVTGE